MKTFLTFLFALISFLASPGWCGDQVIRVGSKRDTEAYLLAEIIAKLIESQTDIGVERRLGLGGTSVAFEAIQTGAIDLYPEYTGTAIQVILKAERELDWKEMTRIFRERHDLTWIEPFGFNNTYAMAMRKSEANERGITRISDLRAHPDLAFGLTHEFLERPDGWPGLSRIYGLASQNVRGLEHGLAYESIAAGKVDVIDAYSTDAKIDHFKLQILEEDLNFFPKYLAAVLVRRDVLERYPGLQEVLEKLSGRLSEDKMRALNGEIQIRKRDFEEVAYEFLKGEGLLKEARGIGRRGLLALTGQHLMLVFISLSLATLVGVPAGILVSRSPSVTNVVLGIAGVFQTIPGIALLVFMIPLFGIGTLPAIVALFIYGLLPILRNTCTGIRGVSPILLEVADGIGLTRRQRLLHVELPLATRVILAGIRTSAVINIGTATLAAFIGAGGLGEPIVTGLALNNTSIVLSGAIPAAGLAILTEILFEGVERWVTPRGLR